MREYDYASARVMVDGRTLGDRPDVGQFTRRYDGIVTGRVLTNEDCERIERAQAKRERKAAARRGES